MGVKTSFSSTIEKEGPPFQGTSKGSGSKRNSPNFPAAMFDFLSGC